MDHPSPPADLYSASSADLSAEKAPGGSGEGTRLGRPVGRPVVGWLEGEGDDGYGVVEGFEGEADRSSVDGGAIGENLIRFDEKKEEGRQTKNIWLAHTKKYFERIV
mgnify:CR=1 FL=1